MTNLDSLRQRCAERRSKLATTVAAIMRNKESAAAAQREVSKVETEEREWIARDAHRRVERALADTGPAPSLVPTDRASLNKRKAELTLAAELQAGATLELTAQTDRKELADAEAALDAAVAEVLIADVLRREVPELAALRAREAAIVASLRALSQVLPVPPAIAIAAADDLHVPVSQLRGRSDSDINTSVGVLAGHVDRDAEHVTAWRARLEQLKAGDDDDGTSESVAA